MSLISAYIRYREQRIRVQTVLVWAEKHLREGELLVVSVEGFACEYRVRYMRLSKSRENDRQVPAVIVCEPNGLYALTGGRGEGWSTLFNSPVFEVWENLGRFTQSIPARHGLSKEHSNKLLAIVRKVLLHKILTGKAIPLAALSKGFEASVGDIVSADVAVWVDGQLRASMIVADKPLLEAVVEASARAGSDARFRPLESDELARARLELTIWSDLEIPLLPLEIAQGDICSAKTYIARKDGKSGWYVPMVFNCVRFTNLKNLLDTLARTKGGFSSEGAQFFLASTRGWIESEKGSDTLALRGPIVIRESIQKQVCLALPKIIDAATRSADWLRSLQQPNGYVESIIDPFESYPTSHVQWIRLALSAYALAEFGLVMNKNAYRDAASHLFSYVSRHIRHTTLPSAERILIEAYRGRAAQTLGLVTETRRSADIVLRDASLQKYDPILYLQSAALLYSVGDRYRTYAETLYRTVVDRFLAALPHDNSLSLAAHAELVILAPLFNDAITTRRIEQWYRELQHADGSFPNTPQSPFAYTRGTGKIFEVMADNPERYEEQLRKSASWMIDMQYDTDTTYFVPDPQKRRTLIGGFRHDALNQQAWIDAAAHFLIGAARLRSRCLFG
jgi:AMMECR1 domain-containing protein